MPTTSLSVVHSDIHYVFVVAILLYSKALEIHDVSASSNLLSCSMPICVAYISIFYLQCASQGENNAVHFNVQAESGEDTKKGMFVMESGNPFSFFRDNGTLEEDLIAAFAMDEEGFNDESIISNANEKYVSFVNSGASFHPELFEGAAAVRSKTGELGGNIDKVSDGKQLEFDGTESSKAVRNVDEVCAHIIHFIHGMKPKSHNITCHSYSYDFHMQYYNFENYQSSG